MKRVINFSGGKTSALMTILLNPTPDDIVLFTDTGREHPATYKFIDDFEKNEGIYVHRATYTHHKAPGLTGFDAMIASKVYLPNKMKRICTTELKVITARRYIRPLIGMKFEQHIGFRFDEKHRIAKFRPTYKQSLPKFILNELGVTKEMVIQYWLSKPYHLEIPAILGNCDLCFLKGEAAIIRILQQFPELADKWIKDEEYMSKKKNYQKAQYFKDITYRQLLNIAKNQKTLFDEDVLTKMEPAFGCACHNF